MMKKILLAICTSVSLVASAQYEKGNFDVSLSSGVGVYGGSSNFDDGTQSGPIAANYLIDASVNYSIMDKVATGIEYERNNFFVDNTGSGDGYGFSNNFRIGALYRLVNADKSCFYVKGGIGLTSFKFGEKSGGDFVKSNGLAYEFKIAYELFLFNDVGLFMNTGWAGYSYNKLYDQDKELWLVEANGPAAKLSLSGVNVRIGLVGRF